jgi:hypothetical protein
MLPSSRGANVDFTIRASPSTSLKSSTDTLPPSWQRLLALSGVASAVLLVFGWFLSGGDAPDYAAADEDWTDWADDNRSRSGIGAFLILLAGFAFLHFAGTIRSVLESAETTVRGSVQLARVAFGVLLSAPQASRWPLSWSARRRVRVPTRIRS